ncbi:MAG: endonuclease MutS2 [Oscillospiraceae bacterium]|nr:endonuclease MutS2 [Oscillospiraceae bacterium]
MNVINKDQLKLELDKILEFLSEQAVSAPAKTEIAKIVPLSGLINVPKIKAELKKTADAFVLSSKFGTPRFSNIADPCNALKRASQGGSLSLRELLDIASVLKEIRILLTWYKQVGQDGVIGIEDCDEGDGNSLTFMFTQLSTAPELKTILERIEVAILSEDEISDSASPELFRIRRSIEKQSHKIREQLDKLTRGSDTKKYLQESLITQRDGRFVVPVKVEHKNEIPGLVHDTSGSGATLFVEPMGVVEANNQIRILKTQEKEEIERIIAELSAMCGSYSDEILHSFTACIKLELCFAKSNLGAKMKGIIPAIVGDGDDSHEYKPIIELHNARHPLIDPDKVVPVNLTIGEDYTSLIVTGPNTGGKTVALKTAGLLTLMARCGLMLPASDSSRIGVFGNIYADIGDEQSIEQSLSTFSSHMNNIVRILGKVRAGDLVLLDELGSGTDPSEGGALAVAILEYLREKDCLTIGTTHYQEVKIYALETSGVENASCEFDVTTLRPTYRLITGAPGKSNALAIAKRLGLSDDIIVKADSLVSSENKRFENVIGALEESRREIDELKSKMVQNEREARELTSKLELERASLAEKRAKELNIARQQALSIVEVARQNADKLLDELETLKRNKDKSDFVGKMQGMRSRTNTALNKLHDAANPVSTRDDSGGYKPPRPYKKYDTVRLVDIDKTGSLISPPDASGNCLVQLGIVKTKTNVKNLRLIEDDKITLNGDKLSKSNKGVIFPKKHNGRNSSHGGRSGTMSECDIRGMTCDEGVTSVGLFIDSCIMNRLHSVTIIHGKGTGVLRQAVHDELRRHRQVKDYRLGRFGEGEDGVTIVQLDTD